LLSILTNPSLFSGLQTLREVNTRVAESSKAVSTGQKVRGALDDASNFAISHGLRGELRAIDAVIQGLNSAKGVAKVAVAGAEATSDILNDIRVKIIEASNPGITTQQRQIIQNDYVNLLADMRNILENSTFNSINLLIEIAVPFNLAVGQVLNLDVLSNTRGDTIRLGGHRLDLIYARLANEDLNSIANANAALNIWNTNISFMNSALGDLGADSRQLEFQVDNLIQIRDQVSGGLGNIVDADLAREAAALAAAQVQQQLSVQTLNIAKSQPTIVQQLFERG
jgi:flagellin